MAKPQTLKAEGRARTGSGSLKQMRREGFVPAVVYGGGAENQNVKINAKVFRDMLKASASDSILVNLDLDGGGTQLAFLQDVQQNALTGQYLHVDFLAVDAKTAITANLPLVFTGEAVGVKAGGLLEQLLYTVEISCLPNDLPESIAADVSDLAIGEALHIGKIDFPEGVTPVLSADVVVAVVAKTRLAKSDDAVGADAEAAPAAEAEAAAE